MKASIRTVPIASKKLIGRIDASDVRCDCDAVVLMPPQPLVEVPWDWKMSDDPAVPMLAPATLLVAL
jgi:hypothetical protein